MYSIIMKDESLYHSTLGLGGLRLSDHKCFP